MNYEDRLDAILELCKVRPYRSEEIAEYFGLGMQAAYGCMRKLRENGCVERIRYKDQPNNVSAAYVATGKPFPRRTTANYTRGITVMGVRL